ncbi:MAG: right-handed parallel beta-helix repeat-containing protein [Phycisphaerales bacterium]|nr:right-handed parallel beta-helix repeat-containing protein [Phycisphaerales bacterium]
MGKKLAAVLCALSITASASFVSAADSASATSVPTFHCLSLYWSPEGGAKEKQVLVKFREAGAQKWREGLPMRYNPINTNANKVSGRLLPPNITNDYRGSIVNLKPNTAYEVALTLEGTNITTSLKATTWNENFPIASTVKCPSGTTTLEVKKSGSPKGYVLYDGTGSTIDTNNQSDMGINVNAEYVILRGFTIKNVKTNGVNIEKGHHIVVENCDISKWGSEDPKTPGKGFGIEMNAGVYSKDRGLHALVVQRCKIHHPTWNTNYWSEMHNTWHPDGPQTIVMWEPEGNNVIRYNECWGEDTHKYNDVMGGSFNASYRGWPGCDSDIYCNYIANCADDGIEIEGGGQNVRCFNNYIEHTMMMIANAATSVGPLYIWQNVTGPSFTPSGGSGGQWKNVHGNFMKMGFADSDSWMTGHMYVFNNTIFQGPNNTASDGPGGDSRIIKHCVTRNNIFHARPDDTNSISTEKKKSTDNDFDHDLISHRVPPDSEKNGIKGLPKYAAGAGFNFETKTGNFQLAPDSPGYRKATVIPNFCEPINGNPRDVGAHQSGTPPMVYGVKANFVPPDVK